LHIGFDYRLFQFESQKKNDSNLSTFGVFVLITFMVSCVPLNDFATRQTKGRIIKVNKIIKVESTPSQKTC
jgi:hypothetical protein